MTQGPFYSPPPAPPTLGYHGGPAGPELPKGLAVASLVLGICSVTVCIIPYLGLCVAPICAVLAIIFGVIARNAADRGEAGGRGMATAGLICGIVSVSLLLFVLLLAGIGIGFGIMNAPNTPATPVNVPVGG